MFLFPFFASGTNKLMIIKKLLLFCIRLSVATRIYPEINLIIYWFQTIHCTNLLYGFRRFGIQHIVTALMFLLCL